MVRGGAANARSDVKFQASHCDTMRLPHRVETRQRVATALPLIRLPKEMALWTLPAGWMEKDAMIVRHRGRGAMTSGPCGRALPLGSTFLTKDMPMARCS